MTEKQWLESTSIHSMLSFLRGVHFDFLIWVGWRKLLSVQIKPRCLRLFACACCRRIPQILTDKRLLQGIEAVEQLVEGYKQREELESVFQTIKEIYQVSRSTFGETTRIMHYGVWAIWTLVEWKSHQEESETHHPQHGLVNSTLVACGGEPWDFGGRKPDAVMVRERKKQCDLLRDIVGNVRFAA